MRFSPLGFRVLFLGTVIKRINIYRRRLMKSSTFLLDRKVILQSSSKQRPPTDRHQNCERFFDREKTNRKTIIPFDVWLMMMMGERQLAVTLWHWSEKRGIWWIIRVVTRDIISWNDAWLFANTGLFAPLFSLILQLYVKVMEKTIKM